MNRIRVLVVDDSSVVRRIVAKVLADDPQIEVVDTALNGRAALEKIEQLRPDVVTLDLEMPVMGGLEVLAALRAKGNDVPVIVFSASDQAGAAGALEALQAGASDYATKASQLARIADAIESLRLELIPKIVALHDSARRSVTTAATARTVVPMRSTTSAPAPTRTTVCGQTGSAPELVVIGTSTGGPKALQAILPSLPASFPVPILIVQHMPPSFTTTLARSLDQRCRLRVAEAYEGAEAKAGEIWIAPGDFHMTLERMAGGCRLHLDQGPKENSCRPAVDPLFRSAAASYGGKALALVLTGMGSDGLEGARVLRRAGARIAIQDEATSVVWGMPGAIANARLADEVLAQDEVALFLERTVAARSRRAAVGTR